MQQDSYKTLGVNPGASPEEIKKAYFRLVRQHSPESDPEGFQKIRRAYEYLKEHSEENEIQGVKLDYPDLPLAKSMYFQIVACMEQGEYHLAMRTAEEAIQYFGSFSGYLFPLALAQRMEGYTGKSVQNLEKLVKDFPDTPTFRRELAFSLMERGFMKKAYAAFEQAYNMGVRDKEFLCSYINCCENRMQSARVFTLAEEAFLLLNKDMPASMPEIMDICTSMLVAGLTLSQDKVNEAIEAFKKYCSRAGASLEDYTEEIEFFLLTLAGGFILDVTKAKLNAKVIPLSFEEGEKMIRDLISWIDPLFPEKDPEWETTRNNLYYLLIHFDPCIPEYLTKITTILPELLKDTEQSGDRFRKDRAARLSNVLAMEASLFILEEWPENQKVLEIFRQKYPNIWKYLEDLLAPLQNEQADIDRLRNNLIEKYIKQLDFYDDDSYFDAYPHRMPGKAQQLWDSDQEGTFRRTQKKIGRNDPCPCGSGKKYKNCCGRK